MTSRLIMGGLPSSCDLARLRHFFSGFGLGLGLGLDLGLGLVWCNLWSE